MNIMRYKPASTHYIIGAEDITLIVGDEISILFFRGLLSLFLGGVLSLLGGVLLLSLLLGGVLLLSLLGFGRFGRGLGCGLV